MNDKNDPGLRRIRRALISVSDKTGIADFAHELKRFGVEIISTGGTAKILREAGVEVHDVSEVTGFPEMMDGRVKTLHPKIHGGLLGLRDNLEHQAAMRSNEIDPIDLVVVNLYPFEATVADPNVQLEDAIEQIDIGGPAMIRSAAKNFQDVTVVTSPKDYATIIDDLTRLQGSIGPGLRKTLAVDAFRTTFAYDSKIADYLRTKLSPSGSDIRFAGQSSESGLEQTQSLMLAKASDLRYGENPHQRAAIYLSEKALGRNGIARAEILGGKEMSFNNYVDADAAWNLVSDIDSLACAIIKHTNPAGVGMGSNVEDAYRKALATDPTSAFGGIVAFNRSVDEAAARAVTEIFTEVVIAPEYETGALEILRAKKNLRLLRVSQPANDTLEFRQISGGMLVQTRDTYRLQPGDLRVVTKRPPTDAEVRALRLAWTVAKHTKSNAIVYARENQIVGVGAGQMSRIDSVKIGGMRAQLPLAGSVLASDAFFPFRDGLDEAAKMGITAVIQPGGSVRDEEVIAAANEHGLAMVFTGIRHFKH